MCDFLLLVIVCFFFFKQKTAYEMRISDWSSDVCSSDLILIPAGGAAVRFQCGKLCVAVAQQPDATSRNQAKRQWIAPRSINNVARVDVIFFRLVEKGIEQIAGGQLIPDAIYRPAHLILRALDFLFDFRRVARVLFSHWLLQYR